MIESGRDEVTSVVAYPTVLTGGKMTEGFGGSKTRIVARRAVVHDAGVIKCCWQEPGRYVAVAAIVVGRYMGIGLACGADTVVA